MRTIFGLLLFFFLGKSIVGFTQKIPLLDVSDKDLDTEVIELEPWSYFPDLLSAHQSKWPGNHEEVSVNKIFNKVKVGTFALQVRIKPSLKNSELAVQVPAIFSSYQLLVDGNLVGSKGKIGTTLASSSPDTKPDVFIFKSSNDTVLFVLEAANLYPISGGITGSLRLGTAQLIVQHEDMIKIMDYALFIVLLLIAVVSFCFYYIIFEHRNVFLWLSLFSFSWLVRSLFGYYYRITDWFEINWEWLMRIEYLSMIFTTLFAMLFIASLFPHDFKKSSKIATFVISGLFIISLFLLSPFTFISQIRVYLGFSSLILSYIFIVIAKAFVDERAGSSMMLVTILMGSIAFGYAIVSYFGFFEMNMMVYDVSFMILGIMLAIAVSIRISNVDRLAETSVLTMEHFFSDTTK